MVSEYDAKLCLVFEITFKNTLFKEKEPSVDLFMF